MSSIENKVKFVLSYESDYGTIGEPICVADSEEELVNYINRGLDESKCASEDKGNGVKMYWNDFGTYYIKKVEYIFSSTKKMDSGKVHFIDSLKEQGVVDSLNTIEHTPCKLGEVIANARKEGKDDLADFLIKLMEGLCVVSFKGV